MEFTIHFNIAGLDGLARSVAMLAEAMQGHVPAVPCAPTDGAAASAGTLPTAYPGNTGAAAPAQAPAAPDLPTQQAAAPAQTAPAAQVPAQAPAAPVQAAPAASAPAFHIDDIARAGNAWFATDPAAQQQRGAALAALNQEFGVKTLRELRPDQLGAYATRLRAMGVGI